MQIARFLNDETKQVFDISSLKELTTILDAWDEEFCLTNRVRNKETDKAYLRFRNELDEYIKEYIETEIKNCSECKIEDLDRGAFCKCEKRNIEYAKYLRENGQSPWKKVEENSLNIV